MVDGCGLNIGAKKTLSRDRTHLPIYLAMHMVSALV